MKALLIRVRKVILVGSECKKVVEEVGGRKCYCRCHTFIEGFKYFNYIEYQCNSHPFLYTTN